MKNIFCPNCGHETTINDEKPFSFCTECGNKIVLQSETPKIHTEDLSQTAPQNNEVDRKLEEAAFYYKLSLDKKEYENVEENPTYYLKAQDLLIDLSEEYPDDYRIWWELCKPIDFMCSQSGCDIHNQFHINEDYFNKALDRAELSKKRKLIDEHDKYVNNKAASAEIAKKKLAEQEKARLEKEAAEKKAYEDKLKREQAEQEAEAEKKRMQEKAERERQYAEQERQRQLVEEEQKRKELEQIEEEKRLAEARQANIAASKPLWDSLSNKDYTKINNTYFEIRQDNNQTIIAVFKLISNMLYLNAFRIDGNKGNAIYQEQGFAMKFNGEGYGVKFDNSPIRIKGFTPPDNILRITSGQDDTVYANNILLKSDMNYISNIMKTAKKSLFSFAKIFS